MTTPLVLVVTPPPGKAPRLYHLWLRHIRGYIDGGPECHCIRCLDAQRDPRVSPKTVGETRVELALPTAPERGQPVYYLCGVSPIGYSNNFHLPFAFAAGETAEGLIYDGTRVRVENARRLEIPDVPDGFDGRPQKQTRCRNWRFVQAWFPPEAPAP